MIFAVHLADVGVRRAVSALRRPPIPGRLSGSRWATAVAPLAIGHVPPRPLLGRLGLISAWDDDHALDGFLAEDAWAGYLTEAYEVRLEPMKSSGSWSALPELSGLDESGQPDEPVAVLTLGRLRLSEAPRFFHASAGAERPLLAEPALLASVGLARPPFLSTFSLWRTSLGMQKYAFGAGGGHASASAAHKEKPFHHESIFLRLRPYRSCGARAGTDPLADVTLPAAR